jgi:lysyl-tRNA synthetase class 2
MPSCSIEALKARALLLSQTRAFFASRSVLEVTTPALSPTATTEPMLDSFEVRLPEANSPCWYLFTSPEFYLKRLLCAGSGAIYQISPVYRAHEVGRRHNPEFSMLEWYQPDYTIEVLMEEVESYFREILAQKSAEWPTVQIAYADLFLQVTGIDPLNSSPEALRDSAIERGVVRPEDQLLLTLDEWLDLLMSTVVEPALPTEQITFVHSYPASQAALARLNPEDSRVAERFEVYLGGMELANGYRELTDPKQQRVRFEAELKERQKIGKRAVPIDERLLEALEKGLPECSGVSIGLDRLLMVQIGAKRIQEVISFAWDRL